MSDQLPKEDVKEDEVPCLLLDISETDVSKLCPAAQLSGVPLGGFVSAETEMLNAELDAPQTSGVLPSTAFPAAPASPKSPA